MHQYIRDLMNVYLHFIIFSAVLDYINEQVDKIFLILYNI